MRTKLVATKRDRQPYVAIRLKGQVQDNGAYTGRVGYTHPTMRSGAAPSSQGRCP